MLLSPMTNLLVFGIWFSLLVAVHFLTNKLREFGVVSKKNPFAEKLINSHNCLLDNVLYCREKLNNAK